MKIYWNDDESMRVTHQGEKYDEFKLKENRFSKRTYEAFKAEQTHQASQRLKEGESSRETLPQDSLNDTHGSGFKTEMNKTTGPFPVTKPIYVS